MTKVLQIYRESTYVIPSESSVFSLVEAHVHILPWAFVDLGTLMP